MTPEQLHIHKVERLSFLLKSYETWSTKYVGRSVTGSMDGLTPSQFGLGLFLNRRLLLAVIERHFASVDCFKAKYSFLEGARLNKYKVAGFTMHAICQIRPIQDRSEEALGVWANEEFAIAIGIGLSQIKMGSHSRQNRRFIDQLRCGLQTADLTAEAIVLILMALDVDHDVLDPMEGAIAQKTA